MSKKNGRELKQLESRAKIGELLKLSEKQVMYAEDRGLYKVVLGLLDACEYDFAMAGGLLNMSERKFTELFKELKEKSDNY